MMPEADDRDPDELALPGPHHHALLGLDRVVRLPWLANRDIQDITLLVVVYVQLTRLQN